MGVFFSMTYIGYKKKIYEMANSTGDLTMLVNDNATPHFRLQTPDRIPDVVFQYRDSYDFKKNLSFKQQNYFSSTSFPMNWMASFISDTASLHTSMSFFKL